MEVQCFGSPRQTWLLWGPILQDHEGFIWLGTNNGLDRYDGYDIMACRNHTAKLH